MLGYILILEQDSAVLGWARLGAGDKTTLQLSFAYHYLHCRRREESRKDIFVKVGQSLKLENSVHGELGVLSPRTPGMARYVTRLGGGAKAQTALNTWHCPVFLSVGARRGLAR